MAMKPYITETYGQMSWYNKYGSPDRGIQNTLIAKRTLSDIYSQSGDFVNVNPHRYTLRAHRGYYGSIKSYAQGELIRYQDGALAQPYGYTIALPPAGFDTDCQNEAILAAYEQVRGSTDVSVDLVQYKQVLQMVSLYRRLVSGIGQSAIKMVPWIERYEDIGRDLEDADRRSRRGRRLVRELNRAANNVAQARLEYVYGWKPLMGTIQDISALACNPKSPGWLRAEGRSKRVSTKVVLQNSIDSQVPIQHFVTTSNRCVVVLYFNPTNSVIDNLSKITSLNPVSVLYEATPFSFVLDWAWGVGEWFRGLETAFVNRNNFVGGYMTNVQRSNIESIMAGYNYRNQAPSAGNFDAYALKGNAFETKFSRVGLAGNPPFPTRPVKQLKFGVEKQLTALALAKATLLRADGIASRR